MTQPLVELDDVRVWFPIKSGVFLDRRIGEDMGMALDHLVVDLGAGERVLDLADAGQQAHDAAQATHLAHILIRDGMDDAARPQEEQRLEEGMGE